MHVREIIVKGTSIKLEASADTAKIYSAEYGPSYQRLIATSNYVDVRYNFQNLVLKMLNVIV